MDGERIKCLKSLLAVDPSAGVQQQGIVQVLATKMVQDAGLVVQESLAAGLPVAVCQRLLVEVVVEEMRRQVFQCVEARHAAGPFALCGRLGSLVASVSGAWAALHVDLPLVSPSFLDGWQDEVLI